MATPIPTPTRSSSAFGRKTAAPKLITGEEFSAMTELGRAELVEGKVIKMPPPKSKHGTVENNISFFITSFVRGHKLGKVVTGESGVYIRRNPDTVRGMDVAYISNERWTQQADPDGYLEIAPDLVVEVLSPDDRWTAVTQKLKEYFSIGVRLVWIADPEAKTVFSYRTLTDVREFTEQDTLSGDDVLPEFNVEVSHLFEA
jgi:Uma2 family endonuclease